MDMEHIKFIIPLYFLLGGSTFRFLGLLLSWCHCSGCAHAWDFVYCWLYYSAVMWFVHKHDVEFVVGHYLLVSSSLLIANFHCIFFNGHSSGIITLSRSDTNILTSTWPS